MQRSLIKVNNQRRKITLWEFKRRCQLVVRLKANKCYQELLCFLSSYINLQILLNLQGFRGQLLAPGRFQTSSPWSRSLTNSDFKGGVCTYTRVWPIVWSIVWSVDCNPIALKWVACFVAIWLFLDESLNLGCLVSQWFSIICLCELSCPLASQTAWGLR